MRLGGPVNPTEPGPDGWIAALRANGYRAANCPVHADASREEIAAYASAARQADVLIAEVGAWTNPLSPDEQERRKALDYCQKQLALADEIGAACCVNIAGSRGPRWDGPHPDNFTGETFDMIVETVRKIIDAVQPKRTFYTLETMPWIFPDTPDSYLDLIQAIDRPQFAVHLDPVNMVCSPRLYYANGALIRECIEKLGPYIKSVHAKDIVFLEQFTTHLNEARPGMGKMDYATLLRGLDTLPGDIPIMLEHLPQAEEYRLAAEYVRSVARRVNVAL